MRMIQRTASSNVTIHTFPFIQFEHTIKINSRGRITYENMSMGYCSFLSLVRDPTGAIVPKNIVPRDRSSGRRKSDLNLFISKFSSLTDCTLIHWPSQLKSTGLIDGSASIRKNIRSWVFALRVASISQAFFKIWIWILEKWVNFQVSQNIDILHIKSKVMKSKTQI